jgi:hypothetical protein
MGTPARRFSALFISTGKSDAPDKSLPQFSKIGLDWWVRNG